MGSHLRTPALAAALAAMTLAGCSGLRPPLSVPAGDVTVCANAANRSEAMWFGTIVQNLTSRHITLIDAYLADAQDAVLLDTLAMPEVTQPDGTTLLLGTTQDLETDLPELWAAGRPVDGFVIEPGRNAAVAFHIARAPGAEVADARTQVIVFKVDGELLDRTATSQQRLILAPDCSSR